MAVNNDEKISDRRRRLFKALSAAPVVMTLRPGEALAQVSNPMQCVDKIMEDRSFVPWQAAVEPPHYRYGRFPAYSPDDMDIFVKIDGNLWNTSKPGTAIDSNDYEELGNGDLLVSDPDPVTYQRLGFDVYVAEVGSVNDNGVYEKHGYYLQFAQNGSHGMTDSCEHSFTPGATTASLI